MHRSSSRRCPPGTSRRVLDGDSRDSHRTRPSGGVVLESVQTFVNGQEVSAKSYAPTSSSKAVSSKPTSYHAPSRSQTIPLQAVNPAVKTVARSASTRHRSPPGRSSRIDDYNVPANVTTKKIVYAYPERSRQGESQDRHHSRRSSVDAVSRNVLLTSGKGGREGRGAASGDAFSYMNARDMYETTEPKYNGARRGSVDVVPNRPKEAPLAIMDSFPAPGRPSRDNYGPPPTTRGLDKVSNGAGISRHGSLREARRRSPPRNSTREAAYSSEDDSYPAPRKSNTLPLPRRTQDRDYSPREEPYDRRAAKKSPPSEERHHDPGLAGRGFGLVPGASDYSGYSREEAPSRVPPIAPFPGSSRERVDPRRHVPELNDDDQRRQPPAKRQDAPVRDRDYEDTRRSDPREKYDDTRSRRDRDDEPRVRDQKSRNDRDQVEAYPEDGRGVRNRQYESKQDDRYDDEGGTRHRYRDELATGAEAALAAGGAAYGANAILRNKDDKHDAGREKDRRYDESRDRDEARTREKPPNRDDNRDRERDGTRTGRDADTGLQRVDRSPPNTRDRGGPSPKADSPDQPRPRYYAPPNEPPPEEPRRRHYAPPTEQDSPEQPRQRHYAQPADPESARDLPSVALYPDEEYRRRIAQEATRTGAPSHDPPQRETHRSASREDDPPNPSSNRYIPPGAQFGPPLEADETADSLIITRKDPPSFSMNPIYTEPHNDPSLAVPPNPDRADNRVRILEPKSILRKPTPKFPDHAPEVREGVAPLKKEKDGVPSDAKWTQISRKLVNPAALTEAGERFEERDDCVIVLRVLGKEEIQRLSDRTTELREKRYSDYKKGGSRREKSRDDRDESDDDVAGGSSGGGGGGRDGKVRAIEWDGGGR